MAFGYDCHAIILYSQKIMKRSSIISLFSFILSSASFCAVSAQGWPADYDGVMLQAFSWDDYTNTRWTVLEKQSAELSQFFSLVWVPQSGNCGGTSMGYNPLYYFDQNSSFGREEALLPSIDNGMYWLKLSGLSHGEAQRGNLVVIFEILFDICKHLS